MDATPGRVIRASQPTDKGTTHGGPRILETRIRGPLKNPSQELPGQSNELLRGLLRDEAQRRHLKIGVVALLPATVAMRIHLNQSRTQGAGTNRGP